MFALAYGIVRWQTSERFETVNERLRLKDDELAKYKRGTNTETPDEAKRLVEDLEQRLRASDPTVLDEAQVENFKSAISATPGYVVFHRDLGASGMDRLAGQLQRAFRSAGWKLGEGMSMGFHDEDRVYPQGGIELSAYSEGESVASFKMVKRAFVEAGIAHNSVLHPGQMPKSESSSDGDWIEVRITQPAE